MTNSIVRLGDVCAVVSGSTPKTSVAEYWDGDVKWITPAELNEDSFYLFDSQRHITDLGKEKAGLSYLPAGTVILSSRAPIGKTAIAGCEMCCNQGFKNLICSDAIFNEYLYYFLKCKTDYLNSLGRGATFKEISKSIVENIEINLPILEEQKTIATQFGEVYRLISLRKQQLAKLDELVKARFVELFTPFFSQQKILLGDLCETITKGTTPTTLGFDFVDNGVNFIKIENISANEKIDTTKMLHISEECNIKLKRSILKENDILFSIAGTKMGITAKVTSDVLPANTNQALAIIRLKKEVSMNVDFLIELLHADMIIEQIESMKSTVAQTNLSLDNIKNFNVIVPPIELQNQFAAFVEQTDKSKLAVQQSLDKLETLKKSLMQKYFG